MSGKFKTTWFRAGLETYKKKMGLFQSKEEECYSERRVDLDDFAARLQEKYEELDVEGYEVINIVPISTGQSEHCNAKGGGYVGDVGFSITRGAVVVGRKK